jgi:hypothetical protein
LINQHLNIKTVSKDRLFFDQYEYCFNFKLEELSTLRELDHVAIDRELDYRSTWRQRHPNFGGSWRGRREEITEKHRINCHNLCDYLLSKQDYKLVIYNDWGYVYSNDLAMLRSMEQLEYVTPASIKQVVLDIPRDSILIKSSEHEWRSYFFAGRMTDQQRESLRNFLANQTDIRIGPGLKRFLSGRQSTHHYINDNAFIDHNGQGIIMMLGLILPRAIRKTLKLIRDK